MSLYVVYDLNAVCRVFSLAMKGLYIKKYLIRSFDKGSHTYMALFLKEGCLP